MDYDNLNKKEISAKLFLSTLYISSVAFGGGLVIIELLRKRFVETYGWIKSEEMTDIIAIAQSTPGAIAGNAAMIIGYRILGVRGALLSLLATVIPPMVIISALVLSYNKIKDNAFVISLYKGMQAGAAAVILNLVYKMGRDLVKDKNIIVIIILITAFIAAFIFNISVPLIILIAACFGIFYSYYKLHKEGFRK
ncbi:MAG: chromate transporter [Eubacteriaceae bacterium]